MGDPENITARHRIFFISQGISQFLLAVFVVSTVWLMAFNRDWQSLNTWHVFLCTVGFSFLMSEAVAFQNPGNVFLIECGRLTRGFFHGLFMWCAAIAIIAGVSIKIYDKAENNREHFTSIHGILGFTSFILTACSFLGGHLLLLIKSISKCGIKPVLFKSMHIFVGIAAYVIGSVTLGYGLYDYFNEATYYTSIGLIVILGVSVGLNLFGPLLNLFRI